MYIIQKSKCFPLKVRCELLDITRYQLGASLKKKLSVNYLLYLSYKKWNYNNKFYKNKYKNKKKTKNKNDS